MEIAAVETVVVETVVVVTAVVRMDPVDKCPLVVAETDPAETVADQTLEQAEGAVEVVVEVPADSLVVASEASKCLWVGCLQLALSGPNQIFVLALEQNHCQPLQLSLLLRLQPRQPFAFLWQLVHLQ